MNRKSISLRNDGLSRRRFLATAAAAPVALIVTRTSAQEPVPHDDAPVMGTIGVAAGQKLRVSVFYHSEIPTGPCVFRMDVYALSGELLGQHTGEVMPGKGTFVDFDVAAAIRKPERVQVHVMVTGSAEEPLEATAEVFDVRSGATQFPEGPCIIPAPLSDHRADGSVGVTRDQFVRLSVFHHQNPNQIPCDVVMKLIGLDGTVLATFQGSVLPGKGFAADWGNGSPGFPVLASGERLQVHANVGIIGPPDVVGITGEVCDAKTGGTDFVFIPCDVV